MDLSHANKDSLGHLLVLGGGAVGMLLAKALKEDAERITVVDQRAAPVNDHDADVIRIVADVTSANDLSAWVAAIQDASVILLSLPQKVILALLPTLAKYAACDALIIETGSVKMPLKSALDVHWADRPAIGINPLFRPSLGIDGQRIAIVCYRWDRLETEIEEALSRKGAQFVFLDAAKHDQVAAITQSLAHACLLTFGAAVTDCLSDDISITDLIDMGPPPFIALLSLCARVTSGETSVYHEIQSAEGGGVVRQILDQKLVELGDTVNDEKDFERFQSKISSAFGRGAITRLIDMSERLLLRLT